MATRCDNIGFFWQDIDVVKEKKPKKEKCKPPERVWEREDFFPQLDLAMEMAYSRDLLSDTDIVAVAQQRQSMFCDVECYPDYFLVCFEVLETRKKHYEQIWRGETNFNAGRLKWILENIRIITFNGIKYDIPMLMFAMSGMTTSQLWERTKEIIEFKLNWWDLIKKYKCPRLNCNHIDLFEHTHASCKSLKGIGARLHTKQMQDLPFKEGTMLHDDRKMYIVRWYCFNDLQVTRDLYEHVTPQIELREVYGAKYGTDLRSKSDAQVAEAVIVAEAARITGRKIYKPKIDTSLVFRFVPPPYISFKTLQLQTVLYWAIVYDFRLNDFGSVVPPEWLAEKYAITIGKTTYTMGIGGLHSESEGEYYIKEAGWDIRDYDVTSYYPNMMLLAKMTPSAIGPCFVQIFQQIVNDRVAAKKRGDSVWADCLKIVANGTFGKLGEPHSKVYAPHLMIQTTLGGQLSILMLIEALEMAGIQVFSANTDGITTRCHESMFAVRDKIIADWQKTTGLTLEDQGYEWYIGANVNNYIAKYSDGKDAGKIKRKGWFGKTNKAKNAQYEICYEAVIAYFDKQVPIEQTIAQCKDIRKFVLARKVPGGGVVNGNYLGKYVRYYYSTSETPPMVSAKSGGKVPQSDGASPLMLLPDSMPEDVNLAAYEGIAKEIIEKLQNGARAHCQGLTV